MNSIEINSKYLIYVREAVDQFLKLGVSISQLQSDKNILIKIYDIFKLNDSDFYLNKYNDLKKSSKFQSYMSIPVIYSKAFNAILQLSDFIELNLCYEEYVYSELKYLIRVFDQLIPSSVIDFFMTNMIYDIISELKNRATGTETIYLRTVDGIHNFIQSITDLNMNSILMTRDVFEIIKKYSDFDIKREFNSHILSSHSIVEEYTTYVDRGLDGIKCVKFSVLSNPKIDFKMMASMSLSETSFIAYGKKDNISIGIKYLTDSMEHGYASWNRLYNRQLTVRLVSIFDDLVMNDYNKLVFVSEM